MLSQYFGFKQDPFGATPDPRCLYPSHAHLEALASLEYGFHSNRGFTAMIAPPGMGKTTLLFRFLEEIRESARSVFLFDIGAECEPREFVAYILRDIGVIPGTTSSEMHEQLSCALAKETRAGRTFVIVIDEAQNLSDAVLERVRLFSNFETSLGKLMQIVLSGQPQLSDKLKQPSLLQLRQRISTVCRIDPLSAEETSAYIEYALKLITEASQGIPRSINNLCFNALSLCCAMKSKQVDSNMVAEVIADLDLIPQSEKSIASAGKVADGQSGESEVEKQPTRPLKRAILATTALVLLCGAGILGLAEFRTLASHRTNDERSLDQKVVPAPVPAPVAPDTGETKTAELAQDIKKFEITVQPNQRLQDISVQYLGGFDLQRLHQIQALNPKLNDPDHIEAGQKIWLPGAPPMPLTKNAMPPAGERKLP
jgi:type II secretory pathway predicted ATPase ExeA